MESDALTRALELCSEAQQVILSQYPEDSDAATIARVDLARVAINLTSQIRYEQMWGKTGDYEVSA